MIVISYSFYKYKWNSYAQCLLFLGSVIWKGDNRPDMHCEYRMLVVLFFLWYFIFHIYIQVLSQYTLSSMYFFQVNDWICCWCMTRYEIGMEGLYYIFFCFECYKIKLIDMKLIKGKYPWIFQFIWNVIILKECIAKEIIITFASRSYVKMLRRM